MLRSILPMVLATCVALPLLAAPRKARVLVFPVKTQAADLQGPAEAITALLLAEALKAPGVEVKALRDVESVLDVEQKKQLLGCASATCATDLAGTLEAEQVVHGSLARLDGGLLLSVARLRTRDAVSLSRRVERLPAGAALDERVRELARALMQDEVSPPVTLELRVLARRAGGAEQTLQGGDKLRQGDQLAFEFTVTPASYVYLVQKTRSSGSVNVLYPQPEIAQLNPLPAGTRVRIPSGNDWFEVDNQDLGLENVHVVASPREMPRLGEAVLALAGEPAARSTRQVEDAMLAVLQDGGTCRKGAGMEASGCAGKTRGLKLKTAEKAPPTARVQTAPGDDAVFYTFTFEHVAAP